MGGMRLTALLLVIAAFNAGCSHTAVAVGNGAPAVAATTVATGATGFALSASGGAAVALVLTIGAIEYINNPQPFPSPMALLPANSPPAPEMAAGRRISEQDCSKPVDLTLGNLRCK
jgi:hypothetical protein